MTFSLETGCKVVILTIYDRGIFKISFSQHAGVCKYSFGCIYPTVRPLFMRPQAYAGFYGKCRLLIKMAMKSGLKKFIVDTPNGFMYRYILNRLIGMFSLISFSYYCCSLYVPELLMTTKPRCSTKHGVTTIKLISTSCFSCQLSDIAEELVMYIRKHDAFMPRYIPTQ